MQDFSKYQILIVDDDSDIREMLTLLLSKAGYGYDSAPDGQEALLLCSKKNFDIILLDIMMPQTDGYEFCRELRKNNQNCYIIYISALDGSDVLEKALSLGGDDFIRKPFEPRELLARIASCLRRLDSAEQFPIFSLKTVSLPCGAQLNPDNNSLTMAEQSIHFTPLEMRLLYLLVSNPCKKFTYAEIYEQVWETDYLNDKGTVATFVSSIKKKLKTFDIPVNIETIWGEGYYYQID